MQIFVLGMHRSGTSVTARLINMMGAYFGPENLMLAPAGDNPRGHWERRDVMQTNDALLKLQQSTWYDLTKWKWGELPETPENLRLSLQKLLQGLDAHRPWFIKDPRLCLTLPAWLPLLEVPMGVMVWRNPAEIAKSLETRSKLPPHYSLALWEAYTVSALNASMHLPRIHVAHADLMARPVETCERIYRELSGLGVRRLEMPGTREIEGFITPDLYRAKQAPPLKLSAAQQNLAEMMQGSKTQNALLHVSPESDKLIRSFYAHLHTRSDNDVAG